MDEVTNVDATPIDNELGTISRAEKWLAKASERVAERSELYKPPKRIENEKQRKDAMDARAQVRKDHAEIDNERKVILRDIEDALKSFKTNVKDVLSPLSDLDKEYKRLLDEYEEQWRTNRVIELTQEYEDIAPDIALPTEGNTEALVPFERLMEKFGTTSGKVWTNRSTNIQAAKEMLGKAIYTIADAENTIRGQVAEEDVQDALVSYFQTLDLQQALSTARRLREQRENLARMEAERAAREAQWANPQPVVEKDPQPMVETYVPPQVSQPMPDVPHAWVISIPLATKEQMHMVADFMRSQGIEFDRIFAGDVPTAYRKVMDYARR